MSAGFPRTFLLMTTALAMATLWACSPQRGTVRAAAAQEQTGAQIPSAQPSPTQAAPQYTAAMPMVNPAPRVASAPVAQNEEPVPAVVPSPAAKPSAFSARPSPAPERESPPAPALVIPFGTRIRVRLSETLDTRDTRAGGTFRATLGEPIVVGDRVAVPTGTAFTGAILQSKSSGRFRGRAQLELTLLSFQMNGQIYNVETRPDTRVSGSHKKRNWWLMGGGSAGGAGIGALAGGGSGALIGAGVGAAAGTTTAFFTGKKNVKLPVETPLVFSLRSSVAVRRA